MTLIRPGAPRATVTEAVDGLVIRIPARKNLFLLLFLPVWLVAWAMGFGAASWELLSPGADGNTPKLFLAVWLSIWTLGGIFCIYLLLWTLAGREIIVLGPSRLSIRHDILGFGRTWEYALEDVRELRAAPLSFNPWDFRSGLQFWGIGGGLIAFDYGASTVRFGSGIEEGEARGITERLRQRHAFKS